MPGINGIEATRLLKKSSLGQGTTIIGISASAFTEEREMFLNAGLNGFIAKPFVEAELFEIMEQKASLSFITTDIEEASSLSPDAKARPPLDKMPPEWREAFSQALERRSISQIRTLARDARTWDPFLSDYVLDKAEHYDLEGLVGMSGSNTEIGPRT